MFYQDADHKVYQSIYDSSKPAVDNSYWAPPVGYSTFSTDSTRLAVTQIIYGSAFNPQTEVFYIGEGAQVLGINMNSINTPPVDDDSIGKVHLTAAPGTSIAAYWPWLVYQDSRGMIREVRDRLLGGFSPAAEWDNKDLNITGLSGTRLALVPVYSSFSLIAVRGGYGIVYQGQDNGLYAVVHDLPNVPDDQMVLSWNKEFPKTIIPKNAAFTAFSTARASDPLQRVNTYVLYVDASSNINVVYVDSDSGWKTSKPSVLQGVDKDTDIACITLATSPVNVAGSAVNLQPPSNESRCYFQRGGNVIEAVTDGTNWRVTGTVPV